MEAAGNLGEWCRASLASVTVMGRLYGRVHPLLPQAAFKIVGVPLQLVESKSKRKQLLKLTSR
jgi:hypothetical protein